MKTNRWVALSAGVLLVCAAVFLSAGPWGCSIGTCRGDLDCPFDQVCEAEACVLSCAYASAACPAGQICVGGHCLVPCVNDTDCAPQVCSAGVCVSATASGGDTDQNTDAGGDVDSGGDFDSGGDDDEGGGSGDSATE